MFNLEKPICRWLRELRAGRLKKRDRTRSLRGFIHRYLRRMPVTAGERVEL